MTLNKNFEDMKNIFEGNLLPHLESLNNFLKRNIDVRPNEEGIELVITMRQLKLLESAVSGCIYDIKEKNKYNNPHHLKST